MLALGVPSSITLMPFMLRVGSLSIMPVWRAKFIRILSRFNSFKTWRRGAVRWDKTRKLGLANRKNYRDAGWPVAIWQSKVKQ